MKHTIKFANWLSRWNSWSGILSISLACSVFVIIVVLLLGLKRRKFNFLTLNKLSKRLINKSKTPNEFAHNWHLCDLFAKPTFCNVCECVMVSGVYCTYCTLHSDEKCLKKADKLFKCKQLCDVHSNEDKLRRNWQHHWIKGNLKLNSTCFVCNENDCGSAPNLSDYKCTWCLRTVHEQCINSVSNRSLIDTCDFGPFKKLILKPNLILNTASLSLKDVRINNSILDQSDFDSWTPLFVFANLKSGSNDADVILSHFNSVLSPLQVIEMNKKI